MAWDKNTDKSAGPFKQDWKIVGGEVNILQLPSLEFCIHLRQQLHSAGSHSENH
jgi:hypothetical protein